VRWLEPQDFNEWVILPNNAKNGILCYKYLFTGGDRKGCVKRSIVLTLEKEIEEG
jgi:hypothetical protein